MSTGVDGKSQPHEGGGLLGWVMAALFGLAGAVAIWVGAPYSDHVIGNLTAFAGSSPITDSYLPATALFVTLLLVLGVNPLLRRLAPCLSLSKGNLALAVGILLVASCIPGQGFLKSLPYAIANVPKAVSENKQVADAYAEMKLPPSLFPDKIGYEKEVPVSEDFVGMLPPKDPRNPDGPKEPLPWKAWLRPLWSWGILMVAIWLMMIGIALIVLPQWRNNERLPFPLLELQEALIESPGEGRFLPPLFRNTSFWTAMGVVFGLHLLAGFNTYWPEKVPAIPLQWNLDALFQEGILRNAPWYLRQNRIYFIFIGLAFFMPNRIGFSIWFTQLGYAAYHIIGMAYFPPFHNFTVFDHRMGATWAVAAGVLWLGRAHWAHVFVCMFSRAETGEDRRNRRAGYMFVLGMAGMFAWLCWVHVHPLWALFFVVFSFTICLVVTRIVAETGMAFFRIHLAYYICFVHLAPVSWISLPVLYFARVVSFLVPIASRVNVGTMAAHAVGLDRSASPRRQWRTGVVVICVLVIGMVVCGAAHLWVNYHHDVSLDGRFRPLNAWGVYMMGGAHWDVVRFRENQTQATQPYNQWTHMGFGAGMAGLLQWMCLRSPKWPWHPIGFLMADVYYAQVTWISIFIGWLTKILMVRYGGARLYRLMRPAFMGLIVGEVFAAVFWSFEPAVRVLCGLTYKIVEIQP